LSQSTRQPLPVDAALPAIVAALRAHGSVVIQAEPGAGKTTRVPPALLKELTGRIVVLEPRRLAAKLSAERVAEELGANVGDLVGYQVRLENRTTAATRLAFLTEGVFTRQALGDPQLRGIACVVLDEFHERHMHTDMALALVRHLQRTTRPDLKLIVMSATLDADAVATYLGLPADAVQHVPGRTFPVAVEYLNTPADQRVEVSVLGAARQMLADARCPGHILVFLTGMMEITRVAKALEVLPRDQADVLPLFADLSPRDQTRVFAPSQRRKIVLATNVAETSITIPGVTGVIDAGKAKIAGMASWSGMPTLDVRRVSQAACVQRAGRAGRTAAGVCYRLFSEQDFLSRPAYTLPDIQRLDFAESYLDVVALLAALGGDAADVGVALPWFERPDPKTVATARELLTWLGALNADGKLTPLGQRMSDLPLHPRLAAVVCQGVAAGIGAPALVGALLVAEGMLLGHNAGAAAVADCDVHYQLDLMGQLARGGRLPHVLQSEYDRGAESRVLRAARGLASRLRVNVEDAFKPVDPDVWASAWLAGFPDRVGKKRSVPPAQQKLREPPLYNFCLGRGGILGGSSVVRDAELILALDATESQGRGADRGVTIWLASAVTPDVLATSPAPFLREERQTIWVDDPGRVDVFERTFYGEVVIAEARAALSPADAARAEEMLRIKLAERWPKPFDDDGDLKAYHARLALAAAHGVDLGLPRFEGEMFELLLAAICTGKRSFKEVAARPLRAYLEDELPYQDRQALLDALPSELKLGNGRTMLVHYVDGKPPYLSGFIQDFYGLAATPTLLRGRLPLTIELLGPNKRPLQVTPNLVGFWQETYPKLKNELSRNYPRHHWPDDPTKAPPILHKNRLPKPPSS
jgi:ATP-dependent helicase HrpB